MSAGGRRAAPGRAEEVAPAEPRPDAWADPDRALGERELTEAELERWGRRLGTAAARSGAFVALHGPLGAGKTRLVQAACRGAGMVEAALSPTFTLVHRYEGERGPIWHVDLYRIESPAELVDLGWDDLVDGGEPVFVEWAERAGEWLPPDRWEIRLAMGGRPDTRRARAAARGAAPPPPAPSEEDRRGDDG